MQDGVTEGPFVLPLRLGSESELNVVVGNCSFECSFNEVTDTPDTPHESPNPRRNRYAPGRDNEWCHRKKPAYSSRLIVVVQEKSVIFEEQGNNLIPWLL